MKIIWRSSSKAQIIRPVRLPGICAAFLCLTLARPANAQKFPSGFAEAQIAIQRLGVTRRALMIAAHPDDENTALLAWLARGEKARTAYLSLTRGEGGQNLIGSEQGQALGLIRTQELLAARRIDGAEQFFTNATDFGFSKTASETLATWNRDRVLGDVVRVIRQFRPDVIILRFSGTPRDGHGHHQSSAILGKEAWEAAADPKRYPEQLQDVQPWRAKRVVWNVFSFTREQEQQAQTLTDRIEVDLGDYDPLLGYSWSEIAGISRSQHQSQGMGSPERRGSLKNSLITVAGDPAKTGLFDGVPVSTNDPKAVALLQEATRAFAPGQPARAIRLLLQARSLLKSAEQIRDLDEAVGLAAGLFLDASTDRPEAAPGAKVQIRVQVVNRSALPLELQSVSVDGAGPMGATGPLTYNRPVAATAEWIAAEHPVSATFRIVLDGTTLEFRRPVIHRYVDPVRGEVTRPFEIVPPVSVAIAEPVFVFPASEPRTVPVEVQSWSGSLAARVHLRVPPGWSVSPANHDVQLQSKGESRTVHFVVTPPAVQADARVEAIASSGGRDYSAGVQQIRYPHIPPITLLPPATARLVRSDVRVNVRHIGYVMGAGDAVPEALRQIGCEVQMLSDEDLAAADLKKLDAIVTGVRAWNTRPALRAQRGRLLEFVNGGGTMVVQYNVLTGGFMAGDPGALDAIGPYPIRTGRERVTVEEAPVETLIADHPLLKSPNRIKAADWQGWVQERGLYFASSWDPKYQAPIATNDPGEKALPGGLLFTRYGKGVYVFTAYSWFRQLPAGVPGAYRIFANLLSAGAPPQ